MTGPLAIPATLARALMLHQAGNIPEAAALYDAILARDPRSFDALHMRGVIAAQSGRLGEARIAVDAVHPFDAAGTYPPIDGLPSAAVAPRTAGPDGRAESTLRLTFPTA